MRALSFITGLFLLSSSAVFAAPTPAENYASLAAPEMDVFFTTLDGNSLLGARIQEKSNDEMICQKVEAVVPAPVPSFTCFVRYARGAAAAGIYAANAQSAPLRLEFQSDGSFVLGVGTEQKSVAGGICRKLTGTYPNAVPAYACYREQ